MRVFPNRYQSDAHLVPGEIVAIPGRTAGFQIQVEGGGAQEEVMCVASDREITQHLPSALQVRDLVPMPIGSLDELATAFLEIDRTGVSQARLPVSVVGM